MSQHFLWTLSVKKGLKPFFWKNMFENRYVEVNLKNKWIAYLKAGSIFVSICNDKGIKTTFLWIHVLCKLLLPWVQNIAVHICCRNYFSWKHFFDCVHFCVDEVLMEKEENALLTYGRCGQIGQNFAIWTKN
jgi:hypothetical protein